MLAAQLPMLLHGEARDALVIGLASGVSLGSALTHPLDHAVVVELEQAELVVSNSRLEWLRAVYDLRIALEIQPWT